MAVYRWSTLHDYKVHFGHWRKLPVIHEARKLLAQRVQQGILLDIGAHDRSLQRFLSPNVVYLSLDVDPSFPHDFYDIDDVKGIYDAVVLFDVIEHIPREIFLNYLRKIHGFMKQDGWLFVKTPNVFHPTAGHIMGNHIVMYPYNDLCAILENHGFAVKEIYRNDCLGTKAVLLKLPVKKVLSFFLDIDYCPNIVVIARKSQTAELWAADKAEC